MSTVNPLERVSGRGAMPRGDEVQPRLIRNPYMSSDQQKAVDYENGFEWAQSLGHRNLMQSTPEDVERWLGNGRAWLEGFAASAGRLGSGTIRDTILQRIGAPMDVDKTAMVPMKVALRARGVGEVGGAATGAAIGGLAPLALGAVGGWMGMDALGDMGESVGESLGGEHPGAPSDHEPGTPGHNRASVLHHGRMAANVGGALGGAAIASPLVIPGAIAGGAVGYGAGNALGGMVASRPHNRKVASLEKESPMADILKTAGVTDFGILYDDETGCWATEKLAADGQPSLGGRLARGGLMGTALGLGAAGAAHASGLDGGAIEDMMGQFGGGGAESALPAMGQGLPGLDAGDTGAFQMPEPYRVDLSYPSQAAPGAPSPSPAPAFPAQAVEEAINMGAPASPAMGGQTLSGPDTAGALRMPSPEHHAMGQYLNQGIPGTRATLMQQLQDTQASMDQLPDDAWNAPNVGGSGANHMADINSQLDDLGRHEEEQRSLFRQMGR